MGTKSLGVLTLDLVAKIGGFTASMGKAERELDKRAKAIEDRARKMGLALGVALAAAGTAAAAGIKSAIDYADKLNDMNQRLGVSAEALSGWGYAAKQTGTDIDALGVGLKKLAKNMAEALDPKSTQGRLFEGLGVSVTDAAGKLRSVEEVLPEVASKFKALDNATLESAMAMDLFGKSGTDLLEFLNQGGDGLSEMRDRARELGIELDGDTLQAADAFNDGLADLRVAVDGLWTQVAADLLPDLVRLVGVFTDLTREGNGTAGTAHKIADGFRVVGLVVESSASLISSLTQILGGFVQQAWGYYKVMAGILSLDMSTLKSGVGTIKASGKNISAGWDRFIDPHGVNALFKPANVGRYDGPLLAPSKMADAAAAAEAAALQRRLARAYGPTDGGGSKRTARRSSRGAFEMPDFMAKDREALAEAIQREAELVERANNAYLDMAAAYGGPLAQAQREHIKNLAEIAQVGKDALRTPEEIKALADAEMARYQLNLAGIEGMSEAMQQQKAMMDGWRLTFNDFFMDVFTGTKSIKDAFKDLFDNIGQMITQRIVDGWIDKLFGKPGTSGAGTSGGNIISSIMGWLGFGGANANGNAFAGGNVIPFANGGVVTAPQFFPMAGSRVGLMGEAGPEAIMPLKRGPDGKLGVRMTGSGSSQINQTFVVNGTPDRMTRQQMLRMAGAETSRAIRRG